MSSVAAGISFPAAGASEGIRMNAIVQGCEVPAPAGDDGSDGLASGGLNPAATFADPLVTLMVAVAAGDRRAFKALYDATSAKLFGIALLLLRRRDAAEDAVQEAYLRVWSKARLFDPARGPVLAWMAQILRNVAFTRLQQERGGHEDIDDHADALVAVVSRPGDRTDLARCLGTLSPAQRNAVLSIFLHGFTHDELAAARRVPLGTAKSWVRRGAERLKTCLEQN